MNDRRPTLTEELLRTFVVIHEMGTITGASARLHVSQPAISRRIAQLERDVGAPVFDRLPAGMRLSAAGHELLPYAQSALAAIEDARRAVRTLRDDERGPVSVALVGTLATTWITGALRRFVTDHPAVDLRLLTGNSHEVAELVRSGEATLGISYARTTDAALRIRPLFNEELEVACSVDHPLANGRPVALRDLADERWLAFPYGPPRTETSARYIHGLLVVAGVPDEAIQTVDSLTAQKRLVEAGFGLALVPASSLVEEIAAGALATIPLRRRPLSPVTLTVRSGGYLSAAAQSLQEDLVGAGRSRSRRRLPGSSRPSQIGDSGSNGVTA